MFGGDSNKQPAFGLGNTATGTQSGFSFTSPAATGTAFGTPATQAQSTGFSFGSAPNLFGPPSTSLFGGGAAGTATTTVAPFGSGAPSIFGSTAPSTAGFGFGSATTQQAGGFPPFGGAAAMPTASTATPSLGLGSGAVSTTFGTPAATASAGGFASAFGQKPATTSTPFGFGTSSGFGTATTMAPQTTATPLASTGFAPSLQFGSTNSSFNLGGTTTTTAAATTAATPFMGFGQSLTTAAPITQTTPLQTGSLLAQSLSTPASTIAFPTPLTSSTPAPVAPLSAFAATPTATATGGITFGTPATTTKLAGFGTTAVAPTTNLTFGSTLTATTTAAPTTLGATGLTTGFSFGAAKTTAPSFSLGTVTTSSIATPAPLTLAATTAGQSLLASSAPSTTTTQAAVSTAIVTNPSVPPVPSNTPAPFAGASINFRKLEEDINKWTSELEEQERIFLTQATQVNAWDRVLIANGEKITQLNDALERVKLDQEHLDTEVDFIEAQQRELEELLAPLEKSVESLPNLSIHQHADLEREQTFQMAENIDAQLRQMSKDLKEIIEHINTTAGTQDTNDPIYQINKILNAHMDSLQWIDQSTSQLQKKVEEVGHLYEMRRQDHQRGVQLPF